MDFPPLLSTPPPFLPFKVRITLSLFLSGLAKQQGKEKGGGGGGGEGKPGWAIFPFQIPVAKLEELGIAWSEPGWLRALPPWLWLKSPHEFIFIFSHLFTRRNTNSHIRSIRQNHSLGFRALPSVSDLTHMGHQS